MPYIPERDKFEDLDKIAENISCAGDLNYIFTVLCQKYIVSKGLRYQQINDVIGALEGCKIELYRRVVSKYEDIKIVDNGDVMEDELEGL
jgi:hypothetical protein